MTISLSRLTNGSIYARPLPTTVIKPSPSFIAYALCTAHSDAGHEWTEVDAFYLIARHHEEMVVAGHLSEAEVLSVADMIVALTHEANGAIQRGEAVRATRALDFIRQLAPYGDRQAVGVDYDVDEDDLDHVARA